MKRAIPVVLSAFLLFLPLQACSGSFVISFGNSTETNKAFRQGVAKFDSKEYEAAIQSWQTALNQFQEKGDIESEAITLGNLGYAHLALNQDSQSLDYYQKSLEVSQKLRDSYVKTTLQADAYNSIGMIYSSAGNFDKAIEAFQQSISIAERGQYHYGQAGSLVNIADVYNSLRKSESAIENLMKSLRVIDEIQNNTPEAIQWKNQTMKMAFAQLSTAYRNLGDVKKADEYRQQSNSLTTK